MFGRHHLLAAAAVTALAVVDLVAPALAAGDAPSADAPPAGPLADCLTLSPSTCYAPRQFQTAYGITPLLDQGIDGRGETIVMPEFVPAGTPGVTDIRADLARFDGLFGLPPANLQVITRFAAPARPTRPAVRRPETSKARTRLRPVPRSGSSCSRKPARSPNDAQPPPRSPRASTCRPRIRWCCRSGAPNCRRHATGAYTGETAWNTPPPVLPQGVVASNGGFSSLFARPAYQDEVPGIGAMRGVPDVAADADLATGPALAFEIDGGYAIAPGGGTSAGAPFWAGIMALADQYAGRPLGLVNPAIYAIGRSRLYHSAFHDITEGSNTVVFPSGTVTGYSAQPGWDPVTGWGTPDAQVLMPLLAQPRY